MKPTGKKRKTDTLLNSVISDEMHDTVKELREKEKEMSQMFKDIMEVKKQLKEKDEELEQMSVDSNSSREELLATLDELKVEKKMSESLLAEAAKGINELKETVAKHCETIEKLQTGFAEKLAEKEKDLKDKDKGVADLIKSINELNRKTELNNKELKIMDNKHKTELEAVVAEKNSIITLYDILSEEKKSLEENHVEEIKELKKKNHQKESIIKDLEENSLGHEEAKLVINEQNQSLSEELSKVKRERDTLQIGNTKYKEKTTGLKKRFEEIIEQDKHEITHLTKKLHSAEEESESKTIELNTIKEEISVFTKQYQNSLQVLEKENMNLNIKFENSNTRNEVVCQQMNAEILKKEAIIKDLSDKVDCLKSTNASLEKEKIYCDKLREQLLAANKVNEENTKENKTINSEIETAYQKLKEQEKVIFFKENKIYQKGLEIEAKSKEIEKGRTNISEKEKVLLLQESENKELKLKCEKTVILSENVQQYKKVVQDLEKENMKIKEKFENGKNQNKIACQQIKETIKNLNNKVDGFKASNESLEKEKIYCDKLRDELLVANKINEEKTKENNTINCEIETAHQNIKDKEKVILLKEAQIEELKDMLEEKDSKLEEMKLNDNVGKQDMEVSDEEKYFTELEGNSSYGSSSSKPSEYADKHKKDGLGFPTPPPLKQTAKEQPPPITTPQKTSHPHPSHPLPSPKAPSPPPPQPQAQKPLAPKTKSGFKAFKPKLIRWGPYRPPPPPPPPPGHPYPWYPEPRQHQWILQILFVVFKAEC